MALFHSPNIVTNGLAFYYDMGNPQKSWRGAPTTNLALFNVASAAFNTDTPSNLTQIANDPVMFQGRLSRRMNILAAGYFNFYIYSYNTSISSSVFTVSCKIKTADGSHPNTFLNSNGYIYGSAGNFFPTPTFTLETDGWYRVSWTYSGTAMTLTSLTGLNGTAASAKTFFITDYQVEALSFSTPFAGVAGGARSSTQSLIDLMGIHTIPTTSLTYNANNTFNFNGSTNRITGSVPAGYTGTANALGRSWEVIVRPGAAITTAGLFGHVLTSGCTYYCNGGICIASGRYHFNWFDNVAYQFLDSGVTATNGQYAHIIGTWNPADLRTRIYVNGELRATGTATNLNYGGAVNEFQVGYFSASNNPYTGTIDVAKYYYNKTLSATEVQQNFQALRGRYGL